MHAGSRFPLILGERLSQCNVMLVLIGPSWVDSRNEEGVRRLTIADDWVRLEIAEGLRRGITIVPVCLRGARLPPKGELPEDIQALVDHQSISISIPGFRHEMAGLARDIRDIRRHAYKVHSKLKIATVAAGLVLLILVVLITVSLQLKFWGIAHRGELAGKAPSSTVNSIWPAAPGEWILFEVDKQPAAYYFKASAIHTLGGSVSYVERYPVKLPDAQVPPGDSPFKSVYAEDTIVLGCNNMTFAWAEKTVYDRHNEILSHFKRGDPDQIDLSSAEKIVPGSILAGSSSLFCSEHLKSLMSMKPIVATTYLSPTATGEGELFYGQPERTAPAGGLNTLLVTKFYQERLFASMFPGQDVIGLPHGYRTTAQSIALSCEERKFLPQEIEYFDDGNNLVSVLPLPSPSPVEIKDGSPLDLLLRKACGTDRIGVAGLYEGVNHSTYITGEADQKIAIKIEQTGNQLTVSFRTPAGGQGTGKAILEEHKVKSIALESTAPSCAGAYNGSLEFDQNGVLTWSFEGKDCNGPMEGHGTAKRTHG